MSIPHDTDIAVEVDSLGRSRWGIYSPIQAVGDADLRNHEAITGR